MLTGAALDDRHRELRGRALSWYAGHKRLGHGRKLTVRLPAGRTALRLVARDRSGRRGVARLRVRVRRRRCGCSGSPTRAPSPAARAG